jgi:hypothetical protein
MNARTAIRVIVASLLLPFAAWSRQVVPDPDVVTIVPDETDELVANPGMGWETFHHTRQQDKNLPGWIPSTVHYARWGWGQIEPRPMCCSTSLGRPYHPDWLEDAGGRIIMADYGSQQGLAIPDLDDPNVLTRHLDFIQRLGTRYDGHPDMDHVDLGTVGWWGEWHMSNSKIGKMPTLENRWRIIDAYVNAFKKTPLLMLVGDGQCLAYATQHGAGWRADCLGDMGGFSKTWCHMRDAYPQLIQGAAAQNVWRTAPVAWETCWDMRRWVSEGWSPGYIFNYALAFHASYVNNKSAPLPEGQEVREEIERFLRRLGYRFVLRQMRHPRHVRAGDSLKLEMNWQSIGSAPCYKPYRVAYRLTNTHGYNQIFVGAATVDKWMPGTVEVFSPEFLKEPPDLPPGDIVTVVDRLTLPEEMLPGQYDLAVGIVGEHSLKPVAGIAIQGRTDDGWYMLSKLVISG